MNLDFDSITKESTMRDRQMAIRARSAKRACALLHLILFGALLLIAVVGVHNPQLKQEAIKPMKTIAIVKINQGKHLNRVFVARNGKQLRRLTGLFDAADINYSIDYQQKEACAYPR